MSSSTFAHRPRSSRHLGKLPPRPPRRSTPDATDPKTIIQAIHAQFASPDYKPPVLPAVATELLGMVDDPNISVARVVSVLEKDPVLAGHVLKLVRSPFYAGATPVLSLQHAIVRLGFTTLQQGIMEIALSISVFKTRAYQPAMAQVAQHSRVTAHIARIVARHAAVDTDLVFLAGLLHDVGYAGILLLLARHARGRDPLPLSQVWYAVQALHAQASQRMAEAWALAPRIQHIVAAHDAPERITEPSTAVVALADILATELGAGVAAPRGLSPAPATQASHPPERDQLRIDAAMRVLFLDERDLDEIRGDAAGILEAIR